MRPHEMRQCCARHTVGALKCGVLGIARKSGYLGWWVRGEDGEVGRAYGHVFLWACPAFLQNHSPEAGATGRGQAASARNWDGQRGGCGPMSRTWMWGAPDRKWGAEDRQGQRGCPRRCEQPRVGEATLAPGRHPVGRGKGLREMKFTGRTWSGRAG